MLVVLAFVKSNAPKRRPRVQISSIKDSPPPFGGRDENFPMTSQVASENKRKKEEEKKCGRKKAQTSICAPLLPRGAATDASLPILFILGAVAGYTQKLSALQLASCGCGRYTNKKWESKSVKAPEEEKKRRLIIRIRTGNKRNVYQQSCCTGGCSIYIVKSLRVSSSVCAPGSY